jgi:hypothetical protein
VKETPLLNPLNLSESNGKIINPKNCNYLRALMKGMDMPNKGDFK